MTACRWLLQVHRFITTPILYRAKHFDIKTMSGGLDAVKRRMSKISEKRKNNKPPM